MSINQVKVTNKKFLILFAALLLVWGIVYQDALLSMEAIWSRSDTFAHGYFILPISLWLIWRDKAYLLQSTVSTSFLPLPLLIGSLFVWLFAFAADINVLGQLSAVSSLILLIWLMIGNQLAWRYKFPLAYLLFAVPMGENLIPWLQDVTAWFTVFFLKLNGIPVYVDGLYIQIPTGMFEVAVACSGIRYLIASVAVGTLFGYLTYNRTYKQILFVVFAIGLPILANGIRAYGIVAIAYYSDMEYATGADHLIYGWFFFGLVIMMMFWIGGLFADKFPETTQEDRDHSTEISNSKNISINSYALYGFALVMLFITLLLLRSIPIVDLAKQQKKQEVSTSNWGINFVDAIETRYSVINDTDNNVEIFTALYSNKQTQGELIASHNTLFNMDRWSIASSKKIIVNGASAMLVHLHSSNGFSRSYLYQYIVGSYVTVNANKAKLMQAWNSLTQQSDYSEIRAISVTNISDVATAEKVLVSNLAVFSSNYSQLKGGSVEQ